MPIIFDDYASVRREGSTPTAATSTPSPSPSSPVRNSFPTGIKALVGFIVIFALIIIGFLAWRIVLWRHKKSRAAPSQVVAEAKASVTVDVALAKTESLAEKAQANYDTYKWQPIARPEPTYDGKTGKSGTRFFGFLASTVTPKPALPTVEPSPPPAYTPQPPPSSPVTIVIQSASPPIPTPLNLAPATLEMLQTDQEPTPMPSPIRTKSIGPDTPLFKSLATAPSLAPPNQKLGLSGIPKGLPRIMIVGSTFVPSMDDELTVRIGELLMMLEEYEDQWCLVQRASKSLPERGVVPRFCLHEAPERLPVMLHRKHPSN